MKGYPTLQRSLNKLAKYNNYETSKKLVKWTGSTWVVSGSNVYNVPSLGTEIATNGSFDSDTSWSKGIGWTISGGFANQDGSNVSASYLQQSKTFSVGSWYAGAYDIVARSQGATRMTYGGNDAAFKSTIQTHRFYSRATIATSPILMTGDTGPTFIGSIDNITVKVLTLNTLFASILGTANNLTSTAKISSLTTGTQAGIVSLLNSTSSPSSFLIAYHDGTNVRLEKCVSGTYTTLVTTAVAFTANATIEIRRPSGNTFQLWYNGVQINTDQTVSDSEIINNNLYGMFSTYSDNLISEFTLGGVVIPFTF